MEELTTESAIIVHGEINSIEYQWEDANHQAINTILTIDVSNYLKGSSESQIVVKQMGGKIGDLTDEVPGTPVFKSGEEVVFLLLERQGSYFIHSIALGGFRVFVDENNNKQVINDLRNVYLIDPDTEKEVQPEDAIITFSFDTFIDKINSYVTQK